MRRSSLLQELVTSWNINCCCNYSAENSSQFILLWNDMKFPFLPYWDHLTGQNVLGRLGLCVKEQNVHTDWSFIVLIKVRKLFFAHALNKVWKLTFSPILPTRKNHHMTMWSSPVKRDQSSYQNKSTDLYNQLLTRAYKTFNLTYLHIKTALLVHLTGNDLLKRLLICSKFTSMYRHNDGRGSWRT